MLKLPDKIVALRAMQVGADGQLLNLSNIMELTIKNYGCDVVLSISSIEFPLNMGEAISFPSGSGRVYGNTSEIKVLKADNKVSKIFYSQPTINDGNWTSDKAMIYGNMEYVSMVHAVYAIEEPIHSAIVEGESSARLKELDTEYQNRKQRVAEYLSLIKTETRYYEEQKTATDVELVQITAAEFFAPINVKLLYTIEETVNPCLE